MRTAVILGIILGVIVACASLDRYNSSVCTVNNHAIGEC